MIEILDVGIKEIAVVVPKNRIHFSDLAPLFGEREISRIVANSGISSVRVCPEGQTASDLCVEAAGALGEGFDKERVNTIVFVSQTPDYIMPPTSPIIQDRLGVPNSVVTFDINSGCAGYVQGLYLAAMTAASSGGDVLLFAGDAIGRYISEKDRSLRLILGDAGSATIVSPVTGSKMRFDFLTDGSRFKSLIIPAGGARTPCTDKNSAVTEREGGNWRSDQHMFMDGMEIMKFVLHDVKNFLSGLLHGDEEYDTYVFHQANRFIVESLAKKLNLPLEKVPLVVDGYGNTNSATIPLALCATYDSGEKQSPRNVFMSGFGVGLSAGAVITDLSNTVIHPVIEGGGAS